MSVDTTAAEVTGRTAAGAGTAEVTGLTAESAAIADVTGLTAPRAAVAEVTGLTAGSGGAADVTGLTGPAAGAPDSAGRAAGTWDSAGPAAVPYCAACGHWAGLAADRDGWQHVRSTPARRGTPGPFDAGHDVELAWCAPPAASVSPAQHEQLLAALDDAITYREPPSASGYATAYRVLRRQLANPARRLP
jgi:hypothetical protein